MLEKDEGIVLRNSRSGETSLMVTFLGRSSGKIRLLAKGALGEKSPWRGMFEPGNHVEVVYYYKDGRTVYFVREASLGSAPGRRRDSLPHLATLLAAMELFEQVCYAESPDARIADIAVDYVRHQDCHDPLFLFLALEIKLLCALGATPDLSACARCGASLSGGIYSPRDGSSYCREHSGDADALPLGEDTAALLEYCAGAPFAALADHDAGARRRKELGKLVHQTYTHHIHGYSLPKSLNLI
jgi:DNA repair protein RecO (recombination protein O)